MKPRNLLLTQTGIAAIASVFLSIGIVISPIAEGYFVRHAQTEANKEDVKDLFRGLQAILGLFDAGAGLAAIHGRYKATPDMYTPGWMGKVGRNIEEVPTDAPLEMVSADSLDYKTDKS